MGRPKKLVGGSKKWTKQSVVIRVHPALVKKLDSISNQRKISKVEASLLIAKNPVTKFDKVAKFLLGDDNY